MQLLHCHQTGHPSEARKQEPRGHGVNVTPGISQHVQMHQMVVCTNNVYKVHCIQSLQPMVNRKQNHSCIVDALVSGKAHRIVGSLRKLRLMLTRSDVSLRQRVMQAHHLSQPILITQQFP